jgi:AraC family transcriptional regulator of adaptative response / DNA-3-methyladenine glycosylase II
VDDFESRYRAVASRDRRFEGRFLVAVTTTGVYCRIGCPSRTPNPENVRFFPSPAAAEAAGFRPCKRCRPEQAGDAGGALVTRALRLIADGVADGDGVGDLARLLGVSQRTLDRRFIEAVGASPLQLARSRRVQTARALIAESSMPMVDVAFAAGFGSLRQFNDTMREELGVPPRALRDGAAGPARDQPGHDGAGSPAPAAAAGPAARSPRAAPNGPSGGWLTLRLARRAPFAATPLLTFLADRAVRAVETGSAAGYSRALRTPGGAAVVTLSPADGHVLLRVRLDDLTDLEGVVGRCRRLLDLDSDPEAVAAGLGRDPLLAGLCAARPGMRVPGSAEPFETAVRAVLGQQVSVPAARTLAGRLVARHGEPLSPPAGDVTRLFPTPARLADADLDGLGLTGRRVESIRALSRAVARGDLDLAGGDPGRRESVLAGLPGFGPWTRAYIAMRACGDPDAIPVSDLGLRRALERLGQPGDPRSLAERAEAWRPWRAYAALHLWSSLSAPPAEAAPAPSSPTDLEITP